MTWAFLKSQFEAVRILVGAGAKMHMQDCFDHEFQHNLEDSLTLYETVKKTVKYALDQETVEIASLLCIVAAAGRGNSCLSKLPLDHGVFKAEKLEQALCVAICSARHGAVRTLLARGVDPEAREWRALYAKQKIMDLKDPQQDDIEVESPLLLAMLKFERLRTDDMFGRLRERDENHKRVANILYLLRRAGARLEYDTWRRYLEQTDSEREEGTAPVSIALATIGFDINIVGPAALECIASKNEPDAIVECGLLLDLGSPIDEYGPGGLNALQSAARAGALDVAFFLLDRGANVKMAASKPQGQTALHAALQLGKQDVRIDGSIRPEYFILVDCLLDAGADLRDRSSQGCTVLEAAAAHAGGTCKQATEELQILFQKLLRLGAPITQNNSTLLLNNLIQSHMLECLELVLEAGANPNGSDTAELEHLGQSDLRPKEKDSDFLNSSPRGPPWSPLQLASKMLDFEAIRILYNRGASVNAPALAFRGRTALQAACDPNTWNSPKNPTTIKDQRKVVKYLLDHNANVNAPPAERYGRTALQAAVAPQAFIGASAFDPDIIPLLLDRGAIINAPPAREGGITALQGAAIAGDLPLVKFLVEKGADINAPAAPKKGRTADEGAAERGKLEVLRFLLLHETATMPPDGFETAIKLAGDQNHWHIADMLTQLSQAVRENSAQVPPFLVPAPEASWL